MKRLVIVDDREFWASTLEIACSSIPGVQPVAMRNGERAWSYLDVAQPGEVCALITDLQMPGMDGYELIERIRGDARYASLPIIVVSGSTELNIGSRVTALGANAYFEKPYSPSQLRTKLAELIGTDQHETQ